jgi:hypothetical protein
MSDDIMAALDDMLPSSIMSIIKPVAAIGGILFLVSCILALYYRYFLKTEVDSNADGKVTKAEFDAYVEANCSSLVAGMAKFGAVFISYVVPFETVE